MGARARIVGVPAIFLALAGCGGRVGSSSAAPEIDVQGAGGGDATTAGSSGSGAGIGSGSGVASSSGSIGSGSGGGSSSSSSGGLGSDDGPVCMARTCRSLGYTCGTNSDGCGGLMDCGTCPASQYCGGGGYSTCGGTVLPPDSGTPEGGCCAGCCCPKTCADYPPGTCGVQGDGCGGITATCDTCVAPQFCGGGGVNKCGYGGMPPSPDAGLITIICVPHTCVSLPSNSCCPQSDGCGALLGPCMTCGNQDFCGGDGPERCGKSPRGSCVPKTCADYPAGTCGQQADGCCGLTVNCEADDAGNACPAGQFCGGGGPSLCGSGATGSVDGGEGG